MRELLREFLRDKLAMRQRHVAAARHVASYDVNNTYQYVIAREDAQIGWLRDAVADLGGEPEEVPEPEVRPAGKGVSAMASVVKPDLDAAAAFVDKWTRRIEALPNARHRTMLRVILGETLEHKRFFDQAIAGRTDLLGRRADVLGPSHGEVLATRWIE
jgi:hypothetical protein